MGRFYKVDIRGKNWLQRVNGVAAWTAADEGRILYDEADDQVKFANASEWSNAGQYNDVPLNTILLIESDTALLGYSLLTNKDDMAVFVTKGSVAGGESGGSDVAGGTWTQPTHDHTTAAHTHPVSSHTHSIPSGTVPGAGAHTHPELLGRSFSVRPGNNIVGSGDKHTTASTTGSNSAGATSHNHGGATGGGTATATSGGGANTGSDGTPNTWRPSGRNFTRQQRT